MAKEPEPTPEQTFPAAYYKDGETAVAATQEQAETLEADGWSSEAPDPAAPAKPARPSHSIADRPDRDRPDRGDNDRSIRSRNRARPK